MKDRTRMLTPCKGLQQYQNKIFNNSFLKIKNRSSIYYFDN